VSKASLAQHGEIMSHKISNVVIKNYKSVINAEFKLSSFTPFVGYNNAGKSNCLSSIQWLLKKSSLSEKDFYDATQPIEVIATIEGITQTLLDLLPPSQKTSIEKYVQDETLKYDAFKIHLALSQKILKFQYGMKQKLIGLLTLQVLIMLLV